VRDGAGLVLLLPCPAAAGGGAVVAVAVRVVRVALILAAEVVAADPEDPAHGARRRHRCHDERLGLEPGPRGDGDGDHAHASPLVDAVTGLGEERFPRVPGAERLELEGADGTFGPR